MQILIITGKGYAQIQDITKLEENLLLLLHGLKSYGSHINKDISLRSI